MKQCATIAEISRAFTLNEKQHYAVKIIGMSLLTRWRNTEASFYMNEDIEARLRSDQLQMFLGGEGGTGKSCVIGAIQALCASWRRAGSIVKTALTGKAATIIGGHTWASFLLQIQRKMSIDAVM
jgi:transcriptional regulator with GAF, ATPase, and Fis domain